MILVEDFLLRVVAFLFVAFLAHTALADSTPSLVTFKSILNTIDLNHVSNIEDFIHFLPPSYKKSPVLMTGSHSRQTGTPSHPRVILYGETNHKDSEASPADNGYPRNTDTVYIAFQTDTSSKSNLPNSVEIIEWDYSTRQYSFHSVDFSPNPGPLKKTYTLGDVSKCTACHGNPPRINWTAYPNWPGAFADQFKISPDSTKSYTADEVHTYLDTLTGANPRLKELDLSSYYDPNYALQGFPTDNALVMMSVKTGDQMILRDVPYLFQSPDFQKYKFAFAGAFLKCTNFNAFFPPKILGQLQANALNELKKNPVASTLDLPKSPADLSFEKMENITPRFLKADTRVIFGQYFEEMNAISWLRFLFDGRGLTSYFLNLMGNPLAQSHQDVIFYDFPSVSDRVAAGLDLEFFKELNQDPDVGDLSDLANHALYSDTAEVKDGTRTTVRTQDDVAATECQTLATKSFNSLAN